MYYAMSPAPRRMNNVVDSNSQSHAVIFWDGADPIVNVMFLLQSLCRHQMNLLSLTRIEKGALGAYCRRFKYPSLQQYGLLDGTSDTASGTQSHRGVRSACETSRGSIIVDSTSTKLPAPPKSGILTT